MDRSNRSLRPLRLNEYTLDILRKFLFLKCGTRTASAFKMLIVFVVFTGNEKPTTNKNKNFIHLFQHRCYLLRYDLEDILSRFCSSVAKQTPRKKEMLGLTTFLWTIFSLTASFQVPWRGAKLNILHKNRCPSRAAWEHFNQALLIYPLCFYISFTIPLSVKCFKLLLIWMNCSIPTESLLWK